MKNKPFIFIFFIGFSLVLFWSSSPKRPFIVPKGWPKPVYDFSKNPLTDAKIELGRHLFYDPILSRDSSISCTSCHLQFTAFTHVDHDLSHGINDRIGTRNSPALMNLAWSKLFMWDGAINHLDVQSLAPISHHAEMDNTIAEVVRRLNRRPLYRSLFKEAFGDTVATGERVLKSISQFMLTFVSSNSKYDKVKMGQDSFTTQENKGYQLFQKNCNACHREPLFSTYEFANNGLPVDTTLNDYGRMRITKRPEDSLKFKIPTLRNIGLTYPYMHDGRFKKLMEVLKHYSQQVQHSKTLAPELKNKIALTANDRVDLQAFLLTLTDDAEFAKNPKFGFPRKTKP